MRALKMLLEHAGWEINIDLLQNSTLGCHSTLSGLVRSIKEVCIIITKNPLWFFGSVLFLPMSNHWHSYTIDLLVMQY